MAVEKGAGYFYGRVVSKGVGDKSAFRGIFRTSRMIMLPGDMLRGNFLVLDNDPQPRLSFLRDARSRF